MPKPSSRERGPIRFPANIAIPGGKAVLDKPVRSLIDLLYPRSCVSCDRPSGSEGAFQFICPSCARQITYAKPPRCRTCGYPFFGEAGDNNACEHCAELDPRFKEGRTAVLLKGPARDLVHELKYRRQLHLLHDIREILRNASDSETDGFFDGALLVPVPLHPRKERERGFNQSLLLARELASVTNAKGIAEPLQRKIDTDTQTRLDRQDRRKNLKNAFAIRRDSALNGKERYIVVDDVFTTGSTLNACAAAIRAAGIRKVDVFTFGHG